MIHYGNITTGIVAAMTNANEETLALRLKICAGDGDQIKPCDFFKSLLGINYCSKCFCASNTKLRVINNKNFCPLKKW